MIDITPGICSTVNKVTYIAGFVNASATRPSSPKLPTGLAAPLRPRRAPLGDRGVQRIGPDGRAGRWDVGVGCSANVSESPKMAGVRAEWEWKPE